MWIFSFFSFIWRRDNKAGYSMQRNINTILSSSGVIYPSLSISNFSKAACDRSCHFSELCSSNWWTCRAAATNSVKSTSPSVLLSICTKHIKLHRIPKQAKMLEQENISGWARDGIRWERRKLSKETCNRERKCSFSIQHQWHSKTKEWVLHL